MSPDGRTIFITGTSPYATVGGIVSLREEFVTIAYRAGDGSEQWFARYRGPEKREADIAASLGINQMGSRIVVTGTARYSEYEEVYSDLVTVAYRGTDGHEVWSERRRGVPANLVAGDLAIAPGTITFVVASAGDTLLTIGYAPNGAELWEASYTHGGGATIAQTIHVTPDGTSVFVGGTGDWSIDCCGPDIATISYVAT